MPRVADPYGDIAQRLVDGPKQHDPQRLKAHIVGEVRAALIQALGDGLHQGNIEGREKACSALEHVLQTFGRDLDRMRGTISAIKNGK